MRLSTASTRAPSQPASRPATVPMGGAMARTASPRPRAMMVSEGIGEGLKAQFRAIRDRKTLQAGVVPIPM